MSNENQIKEFVISRELVETLLTVLGRLPINSGVSTVWQQLATTYNQQLNSNNTAVTENSTTTN